MIFLVNSAHASAPGSIVIIAEALWFANMLVCLPFLIAGIVALTLKQKTKLRRNFAFIMGVLNILIGVASAGYWIFARFAWILPFLIPTGLGIYIITRIYQYNSLKQGS